MIVLLIKLGKVLKYGVKLLNKLLNLISRFVSKI